MSDREPDPTPGPAVPGLGGGLDLGSLLGAASQMVQAHQQAANQTVTGSSGGGAVQITVTGGGEFTQVRIDPASVDPADVAMLEDLVLAALHDAMAKVNGLQSGALGGLDLGGLQGFLGAGLPPSGPGAGPED